MGGRMRRKGMRRPQATAIPPAAYRVGIAAFVVSWMPASASSPFSPAVSFVPSPQQHKHRSARRCAPFRPVVVAPVSRGDARIEVVDSLRPLGTDRPVGSHPAIAGGRRRLSVASSASAASSESRISETSAVASSVRGPDGLEYETLSDDPKVYLVRDLLSPEECRAYIRLARDISKGSDSTEDDAAAAARSEDDEPKETEETTRRRRRRRAMTKSNPPDVSLDARRLWPLPFLVLGAAIPSLVRLFESSSQSKAGGASVTVEAIIGAALPPVIAASVAAALLSWIVTRAVRAVSDASSRTSEAVALNDDDDVEFVRPLVTRAGSAAGGHEWTKFEAPVVTRYSPGAVFANHNDASPTRGSEWKDLGGQRVVTVIVYLNTCEKGGGTRFDRLGFTVQPREGSALVFYPADEGTLEADGRTTHESLEAVEEKWIVQLFGRVGPRVPPPLGLPDSFGG